MLGFRARSAGFLLVLGAALGFAGSLPAVSQVPASPAVVTTPVAATPVTAPTATTERPLAALPYTPSLEPAFMDRAVDPCVDFYAYSCNGWKSQNPIPPDESRWSVYGKQYNENQRYLWGLLAAATRAKPTVDPVTGATSPVDPDTQKLGDYFASCMILPPIDRAGRKPIRTELEAIESVKSGKELASLLGKLHLGVSGRGILFGFSSEQDPGDASQRIAAVNAGGLGLPDRDYYLKTDADSLALRAKYVEHLKRMFSLLGEPASWATGSSSIVLRIETDLAMASLSRVDRRDPHKVYHPMNLASLQKLTPSFDWSDYFAAMGVAASAPGFVVDVSEPEFFKEVQKFTRLPIGDIRTYLRWQVARAAAGELSTPFRDAEFDFYGRTLRGVPQPPARWQECLDNVDQDLGELLGKVFVEKVFTSETRAAADQLVRGIHETMGERLRALDWMSDETRTRALEKLSKMRYKIGFPEVWRDYSTLTVARNDYFGNVRRATEFENRRRIAQIGKPIDRGEWDMTAPTVNAYYDSSKNDMNFPAGVLLPPLFDPKMDDAPNYGDTGATIGHELTHGFDDEGRQFDADGNLKDWWTPEDAAKFTERAQCIVDQYAQYPVVDDIKINSKLTLGEDVADLGGTILAWEAWKKATAGMTLEPKDELTPDQRFFVGFAQWVCEEQRPEQLRINAATNPHSPGIWRINGVVANMPEFAQAFSCKPGQPMVREKVCKIW
ncbi:MAG: M13 family metallopeptidase [Thermoanaerobaculia bacterium]